ncbi:hypothetical protein EDB80DRAFT_576972 [Ilyonectria destructans]|nr:hypothetical protein EDB80DRAFT_576972 [Ilyonectria destructans]
MNSILNRSALGGLISNNSWDWNKEIVLITGGCGGIGKLMAEEFAQRKIKVVVLDIHQPKDPFPPGVVFYETDITSPEALHKVAEQIRCDVGDPTVLINNAGVSVGKPLLDCSQSQIRGVFEVNTMSHFWLAQEFLPAMIKRNHGHVVTMASMASFVVIAGNVEYSCTKASALAFHEGLGQELKHRYSAGNVRTTVVHPYWVRTPMIENLIASKGFNGPVIEPEYVAKKVVNQVLGGRGGQLILPHRFGIVSAIRGFPIWLQEWIRDGQSETLRNTVF